MKCDKLKPILPIPLLQNFPFLDYDFDATTNWAVMQELGKKLNETICFINNVLEQKISDYIDKRFNDIMLNAMYDSETETLVLFLEHKEN